MNIRLPLLSTLFVAAVTILPAISSAHNINEREQNQRQRIGRGVRNDSLTKLEAARLAEQQARIRVYEAKSRQDGDGYSARERARTQNRLNNASQDIYRKKHNDRTRG